MAVRNKWSRDNRDSQSADTPEARLDDGGNRFSIYDLPDVWVPRRSIRETLRLLVPGAKIAYRAGGRHVILAAVFQALAGLGLGVQILFAQSVASSVLSEGSASESTLVPLVGFGVATVLIVLSRNMARQRADLVQELTDKYADECLISAATRADLIEFDRHEFHDALMRAQQSAELGPFRLISGAVGLISSVFAVIGASVALGLLIPLLVPIVLLGFVPAVWVSTVRGDAYYSFRYRLTPEDREREYIRYLLTTREHAAEVRAYQFSEQLLEQWKALYRSRLSELRRLLRTDMRRTLAVELLTLLVLAGAVGLSVALELAQQVDPATIATAAVAILVLAHRVGSAGEESGKLMEAAFFVKDILTLMPALTDEMPSKEVRIDSMSDNRNVPNQSSKSNARLRRLEATNVTFRYPGSDHPAVAGVSLSVDQGEMLALVGENGSGKTTLAKLLAGLYLPSSGAVLWNGQELTGEWLDVARSEISVLFQDYAEYVLSASKNIHLGDVTRAEKFVAEAGVTAGADSFIRSLPEGYQTVLGPEFFGGTDLSEGQWQRVALARAVFRNGSLLVLDEPASALDPRAEDELIRTLNALASQNTLIVISHRLSTVRFADCIVVLDNGRITESGDHTELMGSDGQYREMYELQAATYISGMDGMG